MGKNILNGQIQKLVGSFVKQQTKGEWTVIAKNEKIDRKRNLRQVRIGTEIQRIVQQSFLDQRMGLPIASLSVITRPIWEITGVEMSKSLQHANIKFLVHLDADVTIDEVHDELEKSKSSFRHMIAGNMQLRRVPEINFQYDSEEHARRLAQKLVEDDPIHLKLNQ